MKFVMSYSCGKDSTVALHKMIAQGHTPVGLLVMVNESVGRSFFHGADEVLLERYSKALDLPLIRCVTNGENYHIALEEGLKKAIEMGAEAACFGDIDIEGNRSWGEERCRNVGIPAIFPIWHRDRKENVYEIVDLGYRCIIKSLNKNLLPQELLGRAIDREVIQIMEEAGIDICGENGEYHTLVVDGPIFKHPLPYKTGEILSFGDYPVIDVQ
ncbi:MAG: diphthine--ammonia ligase [Lachnospiraceae bacterium]|jgi:diphthine-ammonia ligase